MTTPDAIKNVYGKEIIYPACDVSRLFAQLTNTKTLSQYDINTIKQLGYQVEVETPTL